MTIGFGVYAIGIVTYIRRIRSTRSFSMGVKAALGQKSECFKLTSTDILIALFDSNEPIM